MCTSSFLFGATRVAAEEENPNYKENQKLVDGAITHEEAVVVIFSSCCCCFFVFFLLHDAATATAARRM